MDQERGRAIVAQAKHAPLTGSGTGLMIGVLAAIAAAVVALIVLLAFGIGDVVARRQDPATNEREATTIAARAVDRLRHAGKEGHRPWTNPPRSAVPLGNPGMWFSNDDYPAGARRAGAEGRTVVELRVEPDGRAHDCRITETSGNVSLDLATCKLAVQRGRFKPARNRAGRAVASTYMLPGVRWRLED